MLERIPPREWRDLALAWFAISIAFTLLYLDLGTTLSVSEYFLLFAISAVTVSPTRRRLGLYCQFHRKNIQQAEVCQFLRHLLRHLRGHIIVIWNNGKPHKGEPIREFCRRFPRIHLERFPTYAPELNPDEAVWNQMDNALANGRPDNLDELSAALNKTLRHLRRSQPKLRWCIHQSELPPFLP